MIELGFIRRSSCQIGFASMGWLAANNIVVAVIEVDFVSFKIDTLHSFSADNRCMLSVEQLIASERLHFVITTLSAMLVSYPFLDPIHTSACICHHGICLPKLIFDRQLEQWFSFSHHS